MAFESFRPEIWSGALLSNLRDAHVAVGLCNRNYEGEIREFGDVVKISQIGTVNVNTYTEDSTTLTYQVVNGAQTQLHIDQQYYIAFSIDDVNQAQMKPKVVSAYMEESAWGLSDQADSSILAKYDEANIVTGLGTSGTPIDITSVNVTDYCGLVNMRMNMANVPTQRRYFIVAPWFAHKMLLAKIMLSTNNTSNLDNGFLGNFMGLNIFESNNVSIGTASTLADTRMIAGYPGSITFAEQTVKMEALRRENSFKDAIRGLHVYGSKVFPDRTACLRADYTAEP